MSGIPSNPNWDNHVCACSAATLGRASRPPCLSSCAAISPWATRLMRLPCWSPSEPPPAPPTFGPVPGNPGNMGAGGCGGGIGGGWGRCGPCQCPWGFGWGLGRGCGRFPPPPCFGHGPKSPFPRLGGAVVPNGPAWGAVEVWSRAAAFSSSTSEMMWRVSGSQRIVSVTTTNEINNIIIKLTNANVRNSFTSPPSVKKVCICFFRSTTRKPKLVTFEGVLVVHKS